MKQRSSFPVRIQSLHLNSSNLLSYVGYSASTHSSVGEHVHVRSVARSPLYALCVQSSRTESHLQLAQRFWVWRGLRSAATFWPPVGVNSSLLVKGCGDGCVHRETARQDSSELRTSQRSLSQRLTASVTTALSFAGDCCVDMGVEQKR